MNGNEDRVSADGNPERFSGVVTIEWQTVRPALPTRLVLTGGDAVPAGYEYLGRGQVLAAIGGHGRFGPYDPAATDGRQRLVPGRCAIVDRLLLGPGPSCTFHHHRHELDDGLIVGGLVRLSRVVQSGVGPPSLATGPTLAELRAAFPDLRFVDAA